MLTNPFTATATSEPLSTDLTTLLPATQKLPER
ncbi:hypothetical protein BN8_03998 [Fibrisoma limi BUZ 3]|uniref:Uncharacterized protein n=1 Tax=Fibrisoma limi BUZ 3 TaxID=1185876 RepID=I2GLL7_9BACT|nr:hypothetical protein BN8_03998 [Fibrisoma limi BUZ 3]